MTAPYRDAAPYRDIVYTAPIASAPGGRMQIDASFAPGEGEWRVFVFTGSPGNRRLFTRFLRTAPRDLEIVVISRPGFGKDHDEPVLSFEEQVAAITPFLPGNAGRGAEWADKKIVAMGVSYGGELALQAALTFPEAVRGVVTLSALIDEPHDYLLRLEQLGGAPGVEDFVPSVWRKVRAEIAGRRAQIGPLLASLGDLAAPVEVLHGDFDALVPQSNARTLMRALEPTGLAALEIIPGGTHYIELQYPRRLHQAIGRVIERSERLDAGDGRDARQMRRTSDERTGSDG